MRNILALILGGGQGSRLFPLTQQRSKPAVPIGGKYRLIDIPISNCLNSNINQIYILTQFNSASLNKHIIQAYRFDNFHRGFVDILAAEQSMENRDWYQGTADAVKKNLKHILAFREVEYVLILSGDQIYKMDFTNLLNFHKETHADCTIPVLPISEKDANSFGVIKLDDNNKITEFSEKPQSLDEIQLLNSKDIIQKNFTDVTNKEYLASMGIYLFNINSLIELLQTDYTDFGREIIPHAIKNNNVSGFLFNDYWEDVGSIKSFLKANLDIAKNNSKFDFYHPQIYTHARYLPASKIESCSIKETLISDGSKISNATIIGSVIGIRSRIGNNVTIENSYVMGADLYEDDKELNNNKEKGLINIGIGDNCIIKNAIVDKNARIGKNCILVNKNNLKNFDGDSYYIRDGIIIVPKNSTINDNTEV